MSVSTYVVHAVLSSAINLTGPALLQVLAAPALPNQGSEFAYNMHS